MTTFKKLSAMTMALALALCLVFAFTSCGPFAQECQHADANNDHLCDNCSEALTECADADADHICDICGKTGFGGECADADKDHDCDYCGEIISGCNENESHKCDTCGKVSGECADGDNDHYCDLCYAELTDCADRDNDHKCDVCGDVKSTCEQTDADKNHVCDLCGKAVGEHADSDPMADGHKCNYCGAVLCADSLEDEDHNCDVCGTNLCVDDDTDCKCDVCEAVLCIDVNPIDHKCDVCGKVFSECADGEDGNHDCDICYKSLCADGETVDCQCECGAILCVDADNNHACDNCEKTMCVDGADRDHKCDVCGILFACVDANADHYCDGCGVLVCAEGCTEHVAYAVIVYVEGSNCTLGNGAKVAYFAAGDDYSVVPSYTADQYVIDFWIVSDANNTPVAIIENGDAFVATAAGTYYIIPIFIANKLDGITDEDITLDISDSDAVSNDNLTPEWADAPVTDKIVIPNSVGGTIVGKTKEMQFYLATDPTNAANVVLVSAINSNGKGGSNSPIETKIDADDCYGDVYTITFDYRLDYSYCNSGATNFIFVKDDEGNEIKVATIEHKTKLFTANTGDVTPDAFIFLCRTAADSKPKDAAGQFICASLSSDTWYTLKIEIFDNKVSTYWSLRGTNEYTLIDTQDFSSKAISEKNLTSFYFQGAYWNYHALSYYDNIKFNRPHDCVDADNNHKCDTCEKALCYDGIDADHKCDRCDAVLCYEGEIADHKCDVCAATLSECDDANKNHYCDICGKGGFGGDCADEDVNADGHNCNYCGKNLCVDEDKNHACEICNGLVGGECADANKDHNCDYCGARKFGSVEGSTDCEDAIELEDGTIKKDHKCNYCGAEMNMDQHVDAADDGDHLCDYGCGEAITECKDNDGDYACDDCKKLLCDDLNKDHKCDIAAEHECVWVVTECVDADKNHDCDFTGCNVVMGECADSETDEDHDCDYGCGKVWNECVDTDKNHLCEICSAIVSYCADADADHKCDACGKEGVCADADKNTICDNCGKVIPYNFETDRMEDNDIIDIMHSQAKGKPSSAADTNGVSNIITTQGVDSVYNYGVHYSFKADPANAANQVLHVHCKAVSGGGAHIPAAILLTPTTVDENGALLVLQADVYVESVTNGKNAIHLSAVNDATYVLKQGTAPSTGYQRVSITSYKLADNDYRLQLGGVKTELEFTGKWISYIFILDTVDNQYYVYYSLDGGATYIGVKEAAAPAKADRLGNFADVTRMGIENDTYNTSSQCYVDNLSVVRINSINVPVAGETKTID